MGQVPGICIRGALCFDKNITKLKNLHCDSPMVYFESNPGPKPVEDSTQMLMFMIVFLHFSVTIQIRGVNILKCRPLGALIFASCAWACTKLEAKAVRKHPVIFHPDTQTYGACFFLPFLGSGNHEFFEGLAFCTFHHSSGAQLPGGI